MCHVGPVVKAQITTVSLVPMSLATAKGQQLYKRLKVYLQPGESSHAAAY